MIKKLLLGASILVVFSGCSTIQVDTDYDTSYSFDTKTNYAVVYSDRVGNNSLVNDRIKNAITQSLNARNYKDVAKEDAQLVFVFHVDVQDKADVRIDYQMVGYGGYGFSRGFGMGYGAPMVATPTTYRYTEGKLIIDALNPKTKKIVWRGIATDELQTLKTPQEKTAYINKVVSTIMAKFPPKGSK